MHGRPSGDPPRLLDEAQRILAANWTGGFTVPSPSLYPHQWSWDSAYIAEGLAWINPPRAERELESILAAQWRNGKVPHIAFDPAAPGDAYFPGPDFWRSDRIPEAPAGVATSGLTQPPLHARAALDVFRRGSDEAFLARVYPRLCAQHEYLAGHRDVSGSGLAAIVHPWESGLDNAPLWDESLARVRFRGADVPRYRRRDLRTVAAAERPTDAAYDQYVFLAAGYRASGYDDADLRRTSPFLVEDPLFNAIYLWSTHALAEIASIVGADAKPHRRAAQRIREGLLGRLWDARRGRFLARDALTDAQIDREAIGTLMPLLDPELPPAIRDAVIGRLRSPRFRTGGGCGLMVTTYDALAPDFDRRRYWRGPIWVNTNWLLGRALRQHRKGALARSLDDATLHLVRGAGFREYFDPHTGEGHGSDDFSWTAALVLDLLKEKLT